MQLILNTTKLVEIFIECDDFIQLLDAFLTANALAQPLPIRPRKQRMMSESEMLAIVIFYHYSGFKCFKWYYNIVIRILLKSYFPNAYSYNRFVELMPQLNIYLLLFLNTTALQPPTEANYADSKKLVVCHNRRIKQHKVFAKIARRGKSSTGWFFGFKLHLIINQLGQIVLFKVSPGNVADNNHQLLLDIADKINAWVYADKGYISKIATQLQEKGLTLITKKRKNMTQPDLTPKQKYYLKYRGIIETVFDLLKHIFDVEHSRHRSVHNFFVNLLSALAAYIFWENKPRVPWYQTKVQVNDIKLIQLKEI